MVCCTAQGRFAPRFAERRLDSPELTQPQPFAAGSRSSHGEQLPDIDLCEVENKPGSEIRPLPNCRDFYSIFAGAEGFSEQQLLQEQQRLQRVWNPDQVAKYPLAALSLCFD